MTLDDLAAFGANTEEGLARCMGMEAFYLNLAETVKTEQGFATLKEALEAGNLKEAFEAAHALKGVLANLALTPLLEPVSALTELVRPENMAARGVTEVDYQELLDTILTQHERFCAL